ncbi:hypothetical protein E2C01_022523 [Portunus trituberculatus]|uniref:Uncharacterized protein n=1 Tax=Portunus trituberculatus TaxID=210409 RepID=A0A5B7E7H9_PORTR|nr:hypothetical protein [Portunus trituberculatus]
MLRGRFRAPPQRTCSWSGVSGCSGKESGVCGDARSSISSSMFLDDASSGTGGQEVCWINIHAYTLLESAEPGVYIQYLSRAEAKQVDGLAANKGLFQHIQEHGRHRGLRAERVA